ncbi:MAG: glycosyltransferase family 39 protein [Candidatus Competibacteraceae bacterium]|nr:glycosyltransferase family 39 protein [Candidatus Competibacteraceae bacterium]
MPMFRISEKFTISTWQALALWAIAATIFLSLELAIGSQSQIPWIAAGLVVIVMLFLKWRLTDSFSLALVQRTLIYIEAISAPTWYGVIFLIGLGLRVAWLLANGAHLLSDGQTYFGLAGQLLEQGTYRDPRGALAYWPPGYPLFLIPFYWITNGNPLAVGIANLLLYGTTLVVVVLIARRLAGECAGRVVALLIAVWPNLILMIGIASKEAVLALLLPLALLIAYPLSESNTSKIRNWVRYIAAGTLLGFAMLVQPSFMLLPVAFFLAEWLSGNAIGKATVRVALLMVGMIIVVSPWTMRNIQVLGQVIPVSTNGGDVFYRSNNPLANGGYLAKGSVDLSHLPELEQNHAGYRLGLAWIRENPLDFALLGIRKQVLFLGDDAVGAYESMRRGRESSDGNRGYPLVKALCNAFWIVLWMAVFFGRLSHEIHPTLLLLLLATFAYPLAIDTVFESGGRHHVPVVVMLAVVSAAAIVGRTRAEKNIP